MLKHAHAVRSYPTVRWDTPVLTTILVVETDLSLDKEDQAYNKEAVNDLFEAVTNYLWSHSNYDSAEVRPYHPR